MPFHVIQLFGKLLTSLPSLSGHHEGQNSYYSFQKGIHSLYLYQPLLSVQQKEEIRQLPAEFALTLKNEILFFLWKFGSQNWAHSPFSWHLLSQSDRHLPNLWKSAQLQVNLLSAGCGEQLIRTIDLPEDFSSALQGAILVQSTKHWYGMDAYQKALQTIYLHYPTSESLIPLATARTAKL